MELGVEADRRLAEGTLEEAVPASPLRHPPPLLRCSKLLLDALHDPLAALALLLRELVRERAVYPPFEPVVLLRMRLLRSAFRFAHSPQALEVLVPVGFRPDDLMPLFGAKMLFGADDALVPTVQHRRGLIAFGLQQVLGLVVGLHQPQMLPHGELVDAILSDSVRLRLPLLGLEESNLLELLVLIVLHLCLTLLLLRLEIVQVRPAHHCLPLLL
mmetsp:Transcript_7539/g.21594  ORF Transcript_7539/g.21594 Transcript_7539/m.21594 type:complete len:215 (+) Transcript_7539:233-877(+)